MSFREKLAWISLLSIASVSGLYFWSAAHDGPRHGASLGNLLGTLIVLTVLQTALTIAVAIFKPKEAQAPRDEREKLIDLKAARTAYSALATAIALACFFGAFNPPIIFNTNALLFVLVTAEVLRSICQIIQYRRGA